MKIIDFGEALEVENDEIVNDYVGSLLYVAPEVPLITLDNPR